MDAHKFATERWACLRTETRRICLWLSAALLSAVWAGGCFGQDASRNAATAPAAPDTASLPIVIELFTSEGCSSCPPADEFVRKLDSLQPVHGVQFIVLSEHVTYWDHDGWKDPNSSAALTERQSEYERVLGVSGPYTPQLIVDGAKELRINDAHELQAAFQQAAATPKIPVRIGTVNIDSGKPAVLRAHVEADAVADKKSAEVFVAVALDHVESEVLKGENGGRHLVHVAVVQQITKVGKLEKSKSLAEDVQLKLKPGTDPNNIRVVAFVQASGPGRVLGAALWKAER
jgi:hypothetical protein